MVKEFEDKHDLIAMYQLIFVGDEDYTDLKLVNSSARFSLFDDLKKKVEATEETSHQKAGAAGYYVIKDTSENPYDF